MGVGVSGGVSKKFNVKVFYVMGKALSGELSCLCDRSCFMLKSTEHEIFPGHKCLTFMREKNSFLGLSEP